MKFKPLLLAAALGLTGLPVAVMADSSISVTAKTAKADTKSAMADATVTAKVKAALIREKDMSAMDVNVETNNGVVQLSGFVDTMDQQERAAKVALAVEGVREVKNDVRLALSTGAATGAAKTLKGETKRIVSDTAITARVKAALFAEKNLSAMDVNIETKNGVVQLAGFVDSADQQERAAKVAQTVEGVKEVKNDLRLAAAVGAVTGAATGAVGGVLDTVTGTAKNATSETKRVFSDSTITAKVKTALIGEKDLSAMDVNVETKNGIVQLSGFVESKDQQDRANKVAQSVDGVKEVKNDLRLKSGQ